MSKSNNRAEIDCCEFGNVGRLRILLAVGRSLRVIHQEPGSQTNSTANRGTTSHNGAGTPMVPIKVGSADMEPAMKDQLPSARSGYLIWSCPESKRIPVCHYSLLGTVRSNSPVLTLTPYRACMLYLVSYPKRLVEGCTLLMNWPRFGGLFQGSITQLARAWKKLGTAPLSSLDPRIRSEIQILT